MQRISIIGSGGSGKSTLASRIGQIMRIPVHHLDRLYWQPGWRETERGQWIEMQEQICSEPSWIIDGNYGGTIDVRLQKSDTVIFLDINRFVCLFRAVKRTIRYRGSTRPDMGSGCKEKVDFKFIKWILSYPSKKRPEILNKLNQLEGDCTIHILRSDHDIDRFLNFCQSRANKLL